VFHSLIIGGFLKAHPRYITEISHKEER